MQPVHLSKMKGNNIIKYFKGLDSLRFFAALAVIITHIELIKSAFGFENIWTNPLIFELGSLGVSFFFVLSGFLITYLLFTEELNFGKISIRKFYMRRILRIWPLFYLVFIIGFFILPHFSSIHIQYLQSDFETNYWGHFFSYLFILPNLSYSIFGSPVPHIGQSWSIGVEEQFYLVWPVVFYYFPNKIKSFLWLFIATLLIKGSVLILSMSIADNEIINSLKTFLAMSKIENMIIGAIGAWVFYTNKKRILQLLYTYASVALSIISIPVLIFFGPSFLQDGFHIIYSLAFLIIIINVSTNKNSIINLDNKVFNYLGKISYGIYMYHMMIIPIVVVLLGKLSFEYYLFNLFVYLLSVGITIIIASLSYELFESKFISLKNKIAKPKP